MAARALAFRTGNVLATTFTGTLSERHGVRVERVPTTQRLLDWFELNDFAVGSCSPAQLDRACELRESIHVVATAAASKARLPAAATRMLNSCSTQGHATAVLTKEGELRWHLETASVEDALSVIAADAIALVSGGRDGRLAVCSSATCQAVFLDSSQSRTRRWCDMNSCGNRQKKDRLRAKQQAKTP
ncbi:CGNR zinc finger domain-containing protein [Plantibacter sp. CFBP 8804]|uniref:CGNR zinc finger domain-containing protein n=1 Tax=Plantibacter sp. CFBP 8804 TaxID=2775270 RepID=UPI00177FEC82|nr:ABATE domain-containing protein [Plantibacter sp. CFBP 8804]MBD8518898.1 CGNR zinc finger domain-containing protein [Plantibacter sp. CFBP 8804]